MCFFISGRRSSGFLLARRRCFFVKAPACTECRETYFSYPCSLCPQALRIWKRPSAPGQYADDMRTLREQQTDVWATRTSAGASATPIRMVPLWLGDLCDDSSHHGRRPGGGLCEANGRRGMRTGTTLRPVCRHQRQLGVRRLDFLIKTDASKLSNAFVDKRAHGGR